MEMDLEGNESKRSRKDATSGNLRIGDQWNAITIIALSQSNPLKAIAELVENSVDAKARNITIVRGKEKGETYLRIVDDGLGIPKNEEGVPDFKYVATHVCDSIKRRLRAGGQKGIQGEFGIGLLSFWTLGEELVMRSQGLDGRVHQMTMRKGEPRYGLTHRKTIAPEPGTELIIRPLLAGVRGLSGEKLQWYLASELRNRILETFVKVRIVDRHTRREYLVEPKKYTGRRLAELSSMQASLGLVHCDLYLDDQNASNKVALYRSGTRVLESVDELEELNRAVWSSGYFQGHIDIPFVNLTPGTRLGMIRDSAYQEAFDIIKTFEVTLERILTEQRQAEEQRASQATLTSLHKAFKEALLALPPEEYDWFEIRKRAGNKAPVTSIPSAEQGKIGIANADATDGEDPEEEVQRKFFEYPGPLYRVAISPRSTIVPVNGSRKFITFAQDRKRQRVETGLSFSWQVLEGNGRLEDTSGEVAEFTASADPGLVRIGVTATQGEVSTSAEAVITVTDSLNEMKGNSETATNSRGLPSYTFHRAPGELWRSRYDSERNLVVINNGHKDFVYASRNQSLKLRYLCRLYSKELILNNFPGCSANELIERMIEISLYAEENLK